MIRKSVVARLRRVISSPDFTVDTRRLAEKLLAKAQTRLFGQSKISSPKISSPKISSPKISSPKISSPKISSQDGPGDGPSASTRRAASPPEPSSESEKRGTP